MRQGRLIAIGQDTPRRRGGDVTAWHAPGVADALWYPVTGCKLAAHVPMFVALVGDRHPDAPKGGFEVLAIIDKHPRRKVWWWYQLGVWSEDEVRWLATQRIELDRVGRDPPGDASPFAFRPADPAAWPYPLPEPLGPALGPKRPPARVLAPAEAFDAHWSPDARLRHDADDWPYPGLALGTGRPASREECEARLLRAFRTSASRGGGVGVGHLSRDTCADIPSEMVQSARRFADQERLASGERGPDDDRFEAVRSGWTPTKRDLADWVTALSWLNHVEPRAVRVVGFRAADPPFSFGQIGERLRVSWETPRALYVRAIDKAFYAARRMPSGPTRGTT